MRPKSVKNFALLASAVLCLIVGGRLVEEARRIGDSHNLYSRDAQGAVPPEYILASSLLGGFRSIFMTVLWMRAQELKETGRFYEMVDMYKIISRLQPSHSAAWRFQAWDLSYNVSARFPDSYEDRVFWVFRGLDLLRKEAIPGNRRSPELYWELAFFFHHKIGLDIDAAYPDYQRHLWEQVDRALSGIRPEDWPRFRDIAEVRERYPHQGKLPPEEQERELWRIGERLEKDLGMDAGRMYELCERFGPINWRAPAAQSLYWASLGERIRAELRPDRPAARYLYLLFRSAIDLPYVNHPPGLADGGPFSIPDYRFIPPILDFLDEILRRFDRLNEKKRARGETAINTELMRAETLDFVSQIAMNAFLDGRRDIATTLLSKLEKMTEGAVPLDDPATFARAVVARSVSVLELDGARELIESLYVQALQYLSLGDESAYQRQRNRVELVHRVADARWRSTGGLPALEETLKAIVARVLVGRVHPLDDPERLGALTERLRRLAPEVLPKG